MYEKVVTRSKDVIWMPVPGVVFDRRAIAHARFDLWDSLPADLKVRKLGQTVRALSRS